MIYQNKVLMHKRTKPPYQGMLNLVGGKVEPNETSLYGAYRELREETGICNAVLVPIMTFQYPFSKVELHIFGTCVVSDEIVHEPGIEPEWIHLTENFFDFHRFAGEGNIGHVLAQPAMNVIINASLQDFCSKV